MKDFLASIDLVQIWRLIAFPVLIYLLKLLDNYMTHTKYNHIYQIVKELAKAAVKDVWEYYVKEIKDTDEWTEENKGKAKEMAIQEIVKGLSNEAYTLLKQYNQDFEGYLANAVESALYDVRQESKRNEQH
jgi:hypothetical protein